MRCSVRISVLVDRFETSLSPFGESGNLYTDWFGESILTINCVPTHCVIIPPSQLNATLLSSGTEEGAEREGRLFSRSCSLLRSPSQLSNVTYSIFLFYFLFMTGGRNGSGYYRKQISSRRNRRYVSDSLNTGLRPWLTSGTELEVTGEPAAPWHSELRCAIIVGRWLLWSPHDGGRRRIQTVNANCNFEAIIANSEMNSMAFFQNRGSLVNNSCCVFNFQEFKRNFVNHL